MVKVQEMVERCEDSQCISLTIIRGNNKPTTTINTYYEEQIFI
jgi:hypothetical protein